MQDHRRRPGGGDLIQRQVRDAGAAPGKRSLTEALPAAEPGALPVPVRAKMESYFGADFSAVRVREDARAKELGAIAYARGNELVFQPGKYDPVSRKGQELIGHELTHVLQQREGRAAVPVPPGGGEAEKAPIQRYTDQGTIRLSDHRSMFVHTSADPNKVLFARTAALQASQQALAAAGSFIHLEAAEIAHGFARVQPRFIGPTEPRQRQTYLARQDDQGMPLSEAGPRMGIASDCNNAARTIMGVLHPPRIASGTPPNDQIERPMVSLGGEERQLDVPAVVPGSRGAHEKATLVALTTSLIEYRTAVADRPVQLSHPLEVTAFLQLTAPLVAPGPMAWTMMGTIRTTQQNLYADFAKWAGIDAGIKPEVGDALVAWRLQGDPTAVNVRAYNAMVDVMRLNIEDDALRLAMTTQLALRITQQQQALVAQTQTVAQNNLILQEPIPPEGETEAYKSRKRLATYRRNEAETKRVALVIDVPRLVLVNQALLGYPGAGSAALAAQAMSALGIDPNTPWSTTVSALNDDIGTDGNVALLPGQTFGGGVEAAMAEARGGTDLWNKHWGGVVMTEASGDYVTLENDASTQEEHGAINAEWRFVMYGSRKPGQSFHDANEQGGDFGQRSSAVRFRNPNQTARPLPEQTIAERAEARRIQEERDQALRDKGIPTGLTLRPFSCGLESSTKDRPEDRDPPPPDLFKAETEDSTINTDPALEAEADVRGAAAARHGDDELGVE